MANNPNSFYESEKCFRRYETYIIQAILAYPEEIRFEPEGGRNATTDAARCRDAITSWRRSKWESSLDPVAYARQLRDITVWRNLNYVCIGSRQVRAVLKSNVSSSLKRERFSLLIHEITSQSGARPFNPSDVADAHVAREEDFQALSIAEAVGLIDTGERAGPYVCPNTPDNLEKTIAAIGERLNVVYVIRQDDMIQIF